MPADSHIKTFFGLANYLTANNYNVTMIIPTIPQLVIQANKINVTVIELPHLGDKEIDNVKRKLEQKIET